MALCSSESLLECDGFEPTDQLERYFEETGERVVSGAPCRAKASPE